MYTMKASVMIMRVIRRILLLLRYRMTLSARIVRSDTRKTLKFRNKSREQNSGLALRIKKATEVAFFDGDRSLTFYSR